MTHSPHPEVRLRSYTVYGLVIGYNSQRAQYQTLFKYREDYRAQRKRTGILKSNRTKPFRWIEGGTILDHIAVSDADLALEDLDNAGMLRCEGSWRTVQYPDPHSESTHADFSPHYISRELPLTRTTNVYMSTATALGSSHSQQYQANAATLELVMQKFLTFKTSFLRARLLTQ